MKEEYYILISDKEYLDLTNELKSHCIPVGLFSSNIKFGYWINKILYNYGTCK